jgi:hypothetical protein
VKLLLLREKPQPDARCTLGFLLCANPVINLVTMELPWIPAADRADLGGKKNASCVPLGIYRLVPHSSNKHGRTWSLVNHDLDVVHYAGDDNDPDPDRETCLFHVGNYVTDLEGCIAPGTRTAKAGPGKGSDYMVCDSRKAMNILHGHMNWPQEHILEITEA